MTLEEKLKYIAENMQMNLSDNFDKIVRAKKMLFAKRAETEGEDAYLSCPCASEDGERYCISGKCLGDILDKGKCHCNLFEMKVGDDYTGK